MIPASVCDYFPNMTLLDYAYLSLNVYHYPSDIKLLGHPPVKLYTYSEIKNACEENKQGWHQLQTPYVTLLERDAFYADLYVKIIKNEIVHVAIAIRGTVFEKASNDWEDFKTWYKSILENKDAPLRDPSFFPRLQSFVVECINLLEQLQTMNLLSHYCAYHVTGHSLGGALANLLAASGMQFMRKPYDVISFNAPGIGTMPHILKDGFHEGQVVSIRSTYDFVSAIGEAYGYVINIKVPQEYDAAKEVFEHEHFKAQHPVENGLLESTPFYGGNEERHVINDFAKSVVAQHSMNYLLEAIMADSGLSMITFLQLANWGYAHSQYAINTAVRI